MMRKHLEISPRRLARRPPKKKRKKKTKNNKYVNLLWIIAAIVVAICIASKRLKSEAVPSSQPDKIAYLIDATRSRLDEIFGLPVSKLPEPPEECNQPIDRVYVLVRVGGKLRATYPGTGPTLLEAVRNGLWDAIQDDDYGGPLMFCELPQTRIEIMIPAGKTTEISQQRSQIEKAFALGADEVIMSLGTEIDHYYQWSVIRYKISSHKRVLEKLCDKIGLPEYGWKNPNVRIFRRQWSHYVEWPSENGPGYVELYRHRRKADRPMTAETLRQAITMAADRLVKTQAPNGRFNYIYDPIKDKPDNDKYNTVRLAGTTYAMARLTHFLKDTTDCQRYDLAARRGILFLQALAAPMPDDEEGTFIRGVRTVKKGHGKLGTMGLALLALESGGYAGDYPELCKELTKGILSLQNPDGSFSGYPYDPDKEGGQDYYPGEAMLALCYQAYRTGDPLLISAIERAFPYYRDHFTRQPATAFVLWQVDAWRRFYALRPERQYAAFVFQQIDWLLQWQYTQQNSPFCDYVGGFTVGKKPGISTSTYLEAVIIAYDLARELGDEQRATRYREAAHQGLSFLLRLQITNVETFCLSNPSLSLGGFRKNIVSHELRNDNDQHAITCMITALETQTVLNE